MDWRYCARIVEAEPVLVPWTLETVPKKRMLVSTKPSDNAQIVTSYSKRGIATQFRSLEYAELITHNYKHSLDDGETWQPCGTVA